jgi:isopropylmalate/homocitrate/citramalate synthase
MYKRLRNLKVHSRHYFMGDMIFTAYNGGHQDAIKKEWIFIEITNVKNGMYHIYQ